MSAKKRRSAHVPSAALIERQTAQTKRAQALDYYHRYAQTGDHRWRDRARDATHEALEHAALCGDGGKLVGEIERALKRAAAGALPVARKGKHR